MRNTGLSVDDETWEEMGKEALAYGRSRFCGGSRSKAVRVWSRIVATLRDSEPDTYSRLVASALRDLEDVEVHV